MRKGTILVSCAWILWVGASGQWAISQSYATLESCQLGAEQSRAMLKSAAEGQGYLRPPPVSWACFPDTIDPRAPK